MPSIDVAPRVQIQTLLPADYYAVHNGWKFELWHSPCLDLSDPGTLLASESTWTRCLYRGLTVEQRRDAERIAKAHVLEVWWPGDKK